jgi:hypothetical protein
MFRSAGGDPPAIKQHLLKKDVFPVHGERARYIAIESNPRSREMNARLSIPCFLVTEQGACLTEGTRIIKSLVPCPDWKAALYH